jgi:cysteine desulfurase
MAKSNKIYMDYAASVYPNPSSIHKFGVEAKKKLENARREVAGVLGARQEEIIFTSGGTESNNLAIQGAIFAQIFSHCAFPRVRGGSLAAKKFKQTPPHIITTNIEHPSVLETCKLLAKRKLARISIVGVEANGIVNPKKIKKEIKSNTILISVMYANNEIGTIQPIKEIAKEIRHFNKINNKKILFHTDAVQAANYLDINVERLGVDLLSLSGSKIEGAGRVGVLYKKKIVSLANVFGGGDQEQGLRPGTENLPEILKFSTALKSAQKIREKENKRLTKLRDYFIASLEKALPLAIFCSRGSRFEPKAPKEGRRDEKLQKTGLIFNGDLRNRLPNNVNITIPKIPSDLLVIELSAKGIMASSKSACKSSRAEGSYVIKAIHPEIDSEIGGVRFSLGGQTTKADIDYITKTLSKILTKLKRWYN